MSETLNADLCIIGAGSGGLSVAAGAAQLGRKVVLIEKGEMGGDCLNTGCVPSKALIAAAARAEAIRTAAPFGVNAAAPEIDFNAVMDHVHDVIAEIAPIDSQERFEGLGVAVLREHASFAGPRQVTAGGRTVSAKHFVIATGSSPAIPAIEGLSAVPFFTNETLFENRTLPGHLIVLGGGPGGVEMAQTFRRLGSRVTLIERDTILNRDDPELVDIIRNRLLDEGVAVLENRETVKVEKIDGGVSVSTGGETLTGSHLFVATGRKPNLDGLNLEAAGVAFTDQGVKVDRRLRTTNKRIYAIGDSIGGRQFTHVAGYHASIAIRNILFKMPAANRDDLAPGVVYADPELAHVGLTEAQAREQGDVRITRWPFRENDRARAERNAEGLIKVVTNNRGRILGVSIAGHGAGDLIQPWSQALAEGRKIKSFTGYIAPYPTRGEIAKRVAGEWFAPVLFSKRTKMLISFLSTFD